MLDALQTRLKEMEENNPSENPHPKNFLGILADKIYFSRRIIHEDIQESTSRDRLRRYIAETRELF